MASRSSGTGRGIQGPLNRQVAFSGVGGEPGGPVELGGGLGVAAELVQEVSAYVVQDGVAVEGLSGDDLIDQVQGQPPRVMTRRRWRGGPIDFGPPLPSDLRTPSDVSNSPTLPTPRDKSPSRGRRDPRALDPR